jgi:hypothetical protein
MGYNIAPLAIRLRIYNHYSCSHCDIIYWFVRINMDQIFFNWLIVEAFLDPHIDVKI